MFSSNPNAIAKETYPSLTTVIASYLEVSRTQASALIDLLSFENLCQQQFEWKGVKYELGKIKKTSEFIGFLQAAGQTKWYKGHDYSKVTDSTYKEDLLAQYYNLFDRFGLMQTINYSSDEYKAAKFVCVLGASEYQVNLRVSRLKLDLLSDKFPDKDKILLGLGCNRELGVSTILSEDKSKNTLLAQNKEPTEMNMINLFMQEMLEELVKLDEKYKLLTYHEINTTSDVKSREDKNFVSTFNTAATLKQKFENELGAVDHQVLIAYSRQPFVLRQHRDVTKGLGDNIKVICVGDGLTKAEFLADLKKINLCLAEIAKLINIFFMPEKLKPFDVELSVDQLNEIKNIYSMQSSQMFFQKKTSEVSATSDNQNQNTNNLVNKI